MVIQYQTKYRYGSITHVEQVKLAATYLKKAAQQYYRHHIQTAGDFGNWHAFQIAMRQQYLPPNNNATLLVNLEKLK